MTPEARKLEIIAGIRSLMWQWHAKMYPTLDLTAACFYWSVIAHSKLKELGYSVLITGGTLNWPRINLKNDDGKMLTHFSYQWEPDSAATRLAIAENRMPEMHVWVHLPAEGEIVDLTTRYLKAQCERRTRMRWLAADPPDFLWCRYDQLPDGVYYESSQSAIHHIRRMVERTWG